MQTLLIQFGHKYGAYTSSGQCDSNDCRSNVMVVRLADAVGMNRLVLLGKDGKMF